MHKELKKIDIKTPRFFLKPYSPGVSVTATMYTGEPEPSCCKESSGLAGLGWSLKCALLTGFREIITLSLVPGEFSFHFSSVTLVGKEWKLSSWEKENGLCSLSLRGNGLGEDKRKLRQLSLSGPIPESISHVGEGAGLPSTYSVEQML